ncbi:MAG: alanine--tRNA ligase [Candidatus Hydrothermarchaeota archaeon]|nr:alanine--tRNA ligase [Candidatus Hydrothermarchaeota archaeon]
MSEKEIKEEFRRKAQEEPERYYPIKILKEEGFTRRRCVKCGNYFWSAAERRMCGEPDCAGGYTFIGDTPAKKMDFIQTWKKFSELFKKFGYTPIKRYPVTARWRDDVDFVQASIYDFQPFVVSGEVDPPANPLVVPQFCLRFNDTDNVGITGRHYTGFVMIGQHAFAPPEKYRSNDYLEHIYAWLTKGMKIPKEELQFHEDAWSGGGNMGPSMEFFSRGLEIGNQVYIQYDIKSGAAKELSIKVLDMGMGQERPAWFTLATGTSYEAVFPTVAKKLYKATSIEPDEQLLRRFLPYSGLLNIDGKELDKTWAEIAAKIGTDLEELKNHILPLAGIYSIGDHTRSLLLALSDGALPSNVGGGYNLRVLVRRSLDFVARYGWDISLPQVCEWHARYLKPQYPELMEHLDEVNEILEVEQRKYRETKEKSKRIVASLRGKEVSLEKLIELYDSNGISPEMLKKEGLKIEIPVDFYTRVAERHEKEREEIEKFREFDSRGIDKTEILYYSDYRLLEFSARVLRIFENEYVVLDKTAFYPTSGGQASDRGYMNGCRVVDVFKQGNMVIHHIENPSFREGEVVACKIDWERRRQLAQHHTATHIINGAAREILGEHVWQAGAEKTLDKARLDITHYEALSEETLEKIERKANEIIAKNLKVESRIYRRDEAEAEFGFRLYQGGAVPGRELRVVSINSLDTEACGGTHLHSTGEAELIEIIGSTKIQDGVVRLEYAAGRAARNYLAQESKILQEVLSTAAPHSPNLSKVTPEQLRAAAEVFSVPREELPRAIKKFVREILVLRKEVGEAQIAWKGRKLQGVAQEIFDEWKELKKRKERAITRKASFALNAILSKPPEEVRGIKYRIEELKVGMEETIKAASELLKVTEVVVLFGTNDRVAVVGMCDEGVDIDMAHVVREACKILGGGGGGKPSFAQGAGTKKEKIEEARQFVRKYIREKK